jgi:hypothetical protein
MNGTDRTTGMVPSQMLRCYPSTTEDSWRIVKRVERSDAHGKDNLAGI